MLKIKHLNIILRFITLFSIESILAIPPAPLQNYFPIVIVNNTTLEPNQIYFIAHGNDPNGFPCFLVPDAQGICTIVYPTASGNPSSAALSKTLDQLELATDVPFTSAYLLYMPINASSRGYFSINNPLFFATAPNPGLGGVIGIDDPAVTSMQDPNYYTLYQDFEFGVATSAINSQTQLFLNLSWVDYFCLPMQLDTYSYPGNTPIISSGNVEPAGTQPQLTRENIISTLNADLSRSGINLSWMNLNIPFYENPYTEISTSNYVRVLAAKNSIGLDNSAHKFVGAAQPQAYFSSDYASSLTKGPMPNTSFMNAVYNFYLSVNNPPLYAQIYPANNSLGIPSTVIYAISSDPNNTNVLQFIAAAEPSYNVQLNLNNLAMDQLLSGSEWPFEGNNGGSPFSIVLTNELSKLISGLFNIGQFPFTAFPTSNSQPFSNSNVPPTTSPSYPAFSSLTYFNNPPSFTENGPWYNLYCESLHKLMRSQGQVPNNASLGLGYAYDFDDLLNMSGLINGIVIQDEYANPPLANSTAGPYFVITLGSLAETAIPDITQNNQSYSVTVGPAANGVDVSFSFYDENGNFHSQQADPSGSITFAQTVQVDQAHPFVITFSYEGNNYSYNINLQHQIVTPATSTSTFSTIDQYFQSGVVFSTSGTQENPQMTIQYNSSPPPWAG